MHVSQTNPFSVIYGDANKMAQSANRTIVVQAPSRTSPATSSDLVADIKRYIDEINAGKEKARSQKYIFFDSTELNAKITENINEITWQKDAVDKLIEVLACLNWHARKEAAAALERLKDIKAINPLINALNRYDPTTGKPFDNDPGGMSYFYAQQAIKKALTALAEQNPELLEGALKNSDLMTRMTAAGALGNIGNKKSFESLLKAFQEGNPSAIIALQQLKDKRAIGPLTEALKNDNLISFKRIEIINALAAIGGEEVLDTLQEQLNNPDESVRKAAQEAIEKLKGQP